jgi:pyruvate carboxylase
MVTVFFELNGQPRTGQGARPGAWRDGRGARRKAESGNDAHVAAPMPGVISTVAVSAGQEVDSAGDPCWCRSRR